MKAVALISGGLDSTLAARLILEQGIEVSALNFKTSFCLCDKKTETGCINYAKITCENLGIPLKVMNITEDFLAVVKKPKHGYGSGMNPCIDCRILKFKKAKEFMQSIGGSFIITGEVLGQRPMSQHRKAMQIIEIESAMEGLVLRPLSAKLLSETLPEKEGWVKREKLLDFNGRTRRPQMELAKKFDIKDYPCPAGGCLLTDPEFAKRLKDLIRHKELNLDNTELLKLGRHFRISDKAKLVVGRNEKENNRLLGMIREDDYLFMPTEDMAGPTVLGRGIFDEGLVKLSCAITFRYCDLDGKDTVGIVYFRAKDKEKKIMNTLPISDSQLTSLRI